ncbi:phage portal protein, partial [Vibrio parahaemolyticus]|nr:phage portal protein [Vibrio parahaemolyticus]
NIMHIRGFGMDGICGMIPVKIGRDVIGAALSVEESAAKIFENGLQSSGFLSAEQPLNEEQRERIRSYLLSFVGSKNAGKMMVLEGGMKYNNVTMNPEAAQMLESRTFSIEEICRWFRVPPFMVGHMDKQSSWASSVEGMNMQFLTNTLRPLLVNIEQEISRCLLNGDDNYYAEFSVEGLLRADSAGRSAYYTTALQNGWMSRNDVRRLENL